MRLRRAPGPRLVAALAGLMALAALASGCGGYEGRHLPDSGATVPNAGVTPSVPAGIPSSVASAPTTRAVSPVPKPPPAPQVPASSVAPATGCATVAKVSFVGFRAGKKIRSTVTSFRVTLTQGDVSRTAWTPADPAHPHGMPVLHGVVLTSRGDYLFFLGAATSRDVALRGTWLPGKRATLLVEGLAGDGRSIYQQSRTFSFTTSYPNGKACDRSPAFHYFTEITDADRISRLPAS